MSDTPETDALMEVWRVGKLLSVSVMLDHARKLERERDEAREDAKRATYDAAQETIKVSTIKSHWIEACRERDEAREKLSDWENAALHVESDHPNEVHCGCVPILRKLLADARKDADEWQSLHASIFTEAETLRGTLREIAAADWKTSGELRGMARKALEGVK